MYAVYIEIFLFLVTLWPGTNIKPFKTDKNDMSMLFIRGRIYAKKLHFLRKKRAGYANLKMSCVYCTQKTVTSHIKMRLVFSFFAPSREGL